MRHMRTRQHMHANACPRSHVARDHLRPHAPTCPHARTPTRARTPCAHAHPRAFAPARTGTPAPLRGRSAYARSDSPLRMSNPILTLGIPHMIYSGLATGWSARIAALSRLHRARASSCSSTTMARSPLLRIRVRSARVQSWRSWVGNPMYCTLSTIVGAL